MEGRGVFPWEVDTPDETGESPADRFFREQRENREKAAAAGKQEEYARAMARTTAFSGAPMSQEDMRRDYLNEVEWRILRAEGMLAAANAERMEELGFPDRLVSEDVLDAIHLDARATAHIRWVQSNHYHHRRRPHVERQRTMLNGMPVEAFGELMAGKHPRVLEGGNPVDVMMELQARYIGRELPPPRKDERG